MKTIPIPAGMQTAVFVMERGAIADVPEVLKTYFPGKTPWIVADGNTWEAAGKRVSEELEKAGFRQAEPEVLPGEPKPHPDERIAKRLSERISEGTAPVAVGSGVINDLVKRAAGIAGRRYCCVATAASVDGYTSAGAAMSVEGLKRTMPCPAPYAVVADTDVLESAPAAMLSSGYADLFTKIPAGADWMIVDTMGIEPVRKNVWDLVQKDLRKWLEEPSDLEKIFMGLAATGYSMQVYGDSRPASGAEHLFSHIWEMEGLRKDGEEVSHGFKVAVGTFASILLMDYVIRTPAEKARKLAKRLQSRAERERNVDELLIRGCYGDGAKKIAMDKFLEGSPAESRRELLFEKWERIGRRMSERLYPFDVTESMLKRAHAPTRPAEIGLSREQFLHGVRAAQLIRKRYTILDLLYETGLLDEAMKNLERLF